MKIVTKHFFKILFLIVLSACHENDPAPQEPAGSLEGRWTMMSTDITEYDQQGKVVATYGPTNSLGFTEVAITATEFKYLYPFSNGITRDVPYARVGDKIMAAPTEASYTIKKLTLKKLDLLYVQEPKQSGSQMTHYEHLAHLERQ